MSNELNIEKREINPIKVVYKTYTPNTKETEQHEAIKKQFNEIIQKVAEKGYETSNLRVIGIPVTGEKGLIRYECSIESPESFETIGLDFKTIPGGVYIVLIMEKKPEVIGSSIGLFYSEYVPENNLLIDLDRSVLEMYTADTLEYFIPIIEY